MKAFAVVTILTVCATGSYGISCKTGTAADAKTSCGSDSAPVTICKVTSTYADNTYETLANTANKAAYACGEAADTLKTCQKSGNDNVCYCDAADCNDIEQCKCDGDDKMMPYANKKKNEEWAAAENSAHGMVSKTVSTVLAAFGAWWLL